MTGGNGRTNEGENTTALPGDTSSHPPISKTIEIQLSLPSLRDLPLWQTLHRRILAIPRKVLVLSGSIGLFVIALTVTYTWLASHAPTTSTVTAIGLQRGTPSYPTVLPAGKNIDALGGWTRISPPDRNPVFAYTDKIGNTFIDVSQQPLPADFKQDTASHINQLAVSFHATEKVTTDGGTIYIGTSSDGPQSVIAHKDNLLILIKSSAHVDTNEWVSYINSLK